MKSQLAVLRINQSRQGGATPTKQERKGTAAKVQVPQVVKQSNGIIGFFSPCKTEWIYCNFMNLVNLVSFLIIVFIGNEMKKMPKMLTMTGMMIS